MPRKSVPIVTARWSELSAARSHLRAMEAPLRHAAARLSECGEPKLAARLNAINDDVQQMLARVRSLIQQLPT